MDIHYVGAIASIMGVAIAVPSVISRIRSRQEKLKQDRAYAETVEILYPILYRYRDISVRTINLNYKEKLHDYDLTQAYYAVHDFLESLHSKTSRAILDPQHREDMLRAIEEVQKSLEDVPIHPRKSRAG